MKKYSYFVILFRVLLTIFLDFEKLFSPTTMISLDLSLNDLWMQCSEIRKINSNLVVFGKTTADIDREDYDNDADDDDGDNAEESEGDEFEQETV